MALWPWRHRRVRRLPGLARCARWRRLRIAARPTARRVAPGGGGFGFPGRAGVVQQGMRAGYGRRRGARARSRRCSCGAPWASGTEGLERAGGAGVPPGQASPMYSCRVAGAMRPYQAGGGQRAPLALSAGPASDCSGSPANRRISESPRGVMKSSRRQHRAPSFFSARCTACLPGAAPDPARRHNAWPPPPRLPARIRPRRRWARRCRRPARRARDRSQAADLALGVGPFLAQRRVERGCKQRRVVALGVPVEVGVPLLEITRPLLGSGTTRVGGEGGGAQDERQRRFMEAVPACWIGRAKVADRSIAQSYGDHD